ncbi:GUN4 domain-containing protein [Vacuolonema iberomarrocanum]|uniref:GUN4 domain-containing protein n=1 Tax=Vacuolonema iberomarrocanum TaxID=3454632 RepID=UPI003F6E3182
MTQPFRERQENLKEFEEVYQETIEFEYPFSVTTAKELKDLQHILKLRDEDTAPIRAKLKPKKKEPQPPSPQTATAPIPAQTQEILLESEKGVDYTHLRDLLAEGKWKEADYETYVRMLEVVGRSKGDWIRAEELKSFPCKDLKTIDRLWVHYSKGKFGFSVQKRIWQECGSPKDYNDDWRRFGDRVGWRKKDESWLAYDDLHFDPNFSPEGELPRRTYVRRTFFTFGIVLFSRAATCKL